MTGIMLDINGGIFFFNSTRPGNDCYSLLTGKWPSRQFVDLPTNSMVDLSMVM